MMVVPATTGGGEPLVVRRTTSKRAVVRTVAAERVRNADRAAYLRAKVPVARVRIAAPATWRGSGDTDALPPVAVMHNDDTHVVRLYRSPMFDVLPELRATADDARVDLDKIAADSGWDGGEEHGPIMFADGWEVGLRTRQYSADALKRNDPELYERLAVTTERAAGTRLLIMGMEAAIAAGYVDEVECDEIDGN